MSKFFYIKTFGCQMNENDSLQLSFLLSSKLKLKQTYDPQQADVVIINTCSVREKPEQKVFSEAGRIGRIKNKKNIILGIIGCTAQEYGEKLFSKSKWIDFVVGTHNIHKIPDIISNLFNKREKVLENDFYEKIESISLPTIPYDKSKVKAYVTIMQGCDNFCSYCIVPYVRGREYSRKSSEIIDEVKRLAEAGVKEITLLGQNVNSYGKKNYREINFLELLYEISKIDGIKRIRFTTSHPKDFGDDLIEAIADIDKVCKHIHLPIQSGSNKILNLMKRKYTREEYLEKISKLKSKIPDIKISTDIIVGFPFETDEDFKQTIEIVKNVKYISAFSFKYSPRPFTLFHDIDNVSEEAKKERLSILQNIQKEITFTYNKEAEGKIFEVLVDGISSKNSDHLTGRTEDNRIVNFSGSKKLLGNFVKVKIIKGNKNSLKGEYLV